jgi:DNA-binding NarL/FixJ family response regulator
MQPEMNSLAAIVRRGPRTQTLASIGLCPIERRSEGLAKGVHPGEAFGTKSGAVINMINLEAIKITPRDEEVLRLLAQGCSNKEIAGHLNISPRTVKQHLRTLFLRAGITEGRKRVKLATAMYVKEEMESCSPAIS